VSPRLRAAALALAVPLVAAVTVLVTLSATSAPGSSAATAAKSNGTTIVISNFAFSPSTLHVAPGTTIKITNSDGVAHTVTADNKSFDTGDIAGGASTTITVKSPGKYAYHCDIHNYMTGVIEVK
jgi:plastocyanin